MLRNDKKKLHIIVGLALTALLCVANVAGADTLISLHKPVTGGPNYGGGFPISCVTDGYFNDTEVSPDLYSYWLTANAYDGFLGAQATIDLQGLYMVSSFRVQDTHNGIHFDRGTNAFLIQVSTNGSDFTTVVNSYFNSTEWVNLTIKTYANFSPVQTRYVRFVVVSVYNDPTGYNSGGINELEVYGTPLPSASTAAINGLLLGD